MRILEAMRRGRAIFGSLLIALAMTTTHAATGFIFGTTVKPADLGPNRAIKADVTASSYLSAGYEPWNAVDGTLVVWEWVTAADGTNAWLEIDLGRTYHITHIGYKSRTDPVNWVRRFTVSFDGANTQDCIVDAGAQTEYQYYDVPDVDARYIRWDAVEGGIYTGAADLGVYYVVSSTGTTAPPSALGANLLAGASVAASSSLGPGFEAENSVDDDPGTEWATSGDGDGARLDVDLGSPQRITHVAYHSRSAANDRVSTFRLRFSDGSVQTGFIDPAAPTELQYFDIEDVTTTSIAWEALEAAPGDTGAREIQAFAQGGATTTPTALGAPDFFRNVIPDSGVAGDYANQSTFAPEDRVNLWDSSKFLAYGHYGRGKRWLLDVNEENVFHIYLQHHSTEEPFIEYGIGKGGQLYSVNSEYGEIVPPQMWPWVDEVWQATTYSPEVDARVQAIKKRNGGELDLRAGDAMVHGSGTNDAWENETADPFYAPMLSSWFDGETRSFYVLNWPVTPSLPTVFRHNVLFYSKYRDMGRGALEITSLMFNFSDYSYGMGGIPWGGCRNSLFPDRVISNPDGTWDDVSQVLFGTDDAYRFWRDSGGWMAAVADMSDSASPAFCFAYGRQDESGFTSFGYAPHPDRDFTVMASHPPGTLAPGESYWVRYYLVTGPFGEVASRCADLEGDAGYARITFAEASATTALLYEDTIGSSVVLTRKETGAPVGRVYDEPVTNSKPLFRICESTPPTRCAVTTDPYHFSRKEPYENLLRPGDEFYEEFMNRETAYLYESENHLPLDWTLLGFVVPPAHRGPFSYQALSPLISVPPGDAGMLLRTVCDAPDSDCDGVDDGLDNCPGIDNPAQSDADGDGVGDACSCAVIQEIGDLRVGKLPDGRLQVTWSALTDGCLGQHAVFALTDPAPSPAAPPVFPDDWSEVTQEDEDGDVGGDGSFLWTAPQAQLIWISAVGRGTDKSLGP